MPFTAGYKYTMIGAVFILIYLTPTVSNMRYHRALQENNSTSNRLADTRTTTPAVSPVFVITDPIVKVAPSHMAILPCSVKFLGDRQVVWRRVKEDEFLTIGKMVWSKDPRILVEYGIKEDGVTSWDLLLRNAQYNDAGIYECQVTSSEQIVWNVELKVIDPVTTKPKSRVHKQVTQTTQVTQRVLVADDHRRKWRNKVVTTEYHRSPQREEFLTAGQTVRLVCNTSLVNHSLDSSDETTKIEWYKDGESIEGYKNVLVTMYQLQTEQMYASELIIDRLNLADSGDYLCRFINSDLILIRIYVLPNTTINTANKEDQSHYHAVDSLHTESSAISTHPVLGCWSLVLICITHALLLIVSLSSVIYESSLYYMDKTLTYLTQADPT
ncbi:hypothetical protein BsWGS_02041 [Bradybaena similaris]